VFEPTHDPDSKTVFQDQDITAGAQFSLTGGTFYRFKGINPEWKALHSLTAPASIPQKNRILESDIAKVDKMLKEIARAAAFCQMCSLTHDDLVYIADQSSIFGSVNVFAPSLVNIKRVLKLNRLQTTLQPITESANKLADLFKQPSPKSAQDAASTLALFTGWKPEILAVIISKFYNSDQAKVFSHEDVLIQIQRAYDTCTSLQIADPTPLFSWSDISTEPKYQLTVAKELRVLVRTQMDEQSWESNATSIFDSIRRNSRDALIAATLNRLANGLFDIRDSDSLFEFFLIDVNMGTCLQTSRIKQASNLKRSTLHSALLAKSGKMGGSLALPAGNGCNPTVYGKRPEKFFLYPENWLMPSLRGDKSSVFLAVESALLQGDMGQEDAIRTYVFGLMDIGHLELIALHQGPAYDRVVARTRQSPHKFYQRSLDRSTACGTAWIPVDVDIPTQQPKDGFKSELNVPMTDSYVSPHTMKHDGRLIVFVPVVSESQRSRVVTDGNDKIKTKTIIEYAWEIQMSVSELRDGKWTPKVTS
jgi:hypothetical protein